MTTHQRQILIALLLLPTLTFAEGQWGMDYFIWIIDFIKIFGLWTIGAFVFILVLKKIRQKVLTKKQKYIFWTIILFSAFFHWSMTTYDPHPTEGPIDFFFWKTRVKNKAIADSLSAEEYLNKLAKQETILIQKKNDTSIIESVIYMVENLKLVKDQIKLTESLSNRQRHISLVPTLYDTTKNIYLVKVSEDNGKNLVTYYNFLVDANSMKIINADGNLEGQ